MAIKRISFDSFIFDISYEILNKEKKKDFIFIHGWGSNKELMKNVFKDYFPNYRHIYIDLPGFGKSSNEYVIDSKLYAKAVNFFLKNLNSDKFIILGHSYGGKIALLLGAKNLILLSSAGVLMGKSIFLKLKILVFKFLKPLNLNFIKRFFISKDAKGLSDNMYEVFKKIVNEDFSIHFKNFNNRTFIFWGKDDKATPVTCAYKIKEYIKNSKLYLLEGDHYFFMKKAKYISDILVKELK